jgi:hypothetical protein
VYYNTRKIAVDCETVEHAKLKALLMVAFPEVKRQTYDDDYG